MSAKPDWTLDDVMKIVPEGWGTAKVAIFASGQTFLVKQVRLITNHDGRRIVVFTSLNQFLKEDS